MPNWCWNTIKVDGMYRDKILNDEGVVDFNIVLPMPETLGQVTSGSSNNRDMYMYLSEKNSLAHSTVLKNPDIQILLSNKNRFCSNNEELQYCRNAVTDLIASGDLEEIKKSYEEGKLLIENYKSYGHITWYEWRWNVWGVKWNAATTMVNDEEICFDTPWGPPLGWLEKLAELGVCFELYWENEEDYYGKYVSDGKTLKETETGCIDMYDEDEEE